MTPPERDARIAEARRNLMVDRQLVERGIRDARVVAAFRRVPRHAFVPETFRDSAYEDHPLPIGSGQTISQPYMVALMTECLCLEGGERVLEIGTGCGYQTAILAETAGTVFSVERIPELAAAAERRLAALGYTNCRVTAGDGTLGWAAEAPYKGIVVTAGAPQIPPALVSQLDDGGRMVIPVGDRWSQTLTVVKKRGHEITRTPVCGCVFVPLVGEDGWI